MAGKIGRNKEWCKAYKARGQDAINKAKRKARTERITARNSERINLRVAALLDAGKLIPSKWKKYAEAVK